MAFCLALCPAWHSALVAARSASRPCGPIAAGCSPTGARRADRGRVLADRCPAVPVGRSRPGPRRAVPGGAPGRRAAAGSSASCALRAPGQAIAARCSPTGARRSGRADCGRVLGELGGAAPDGRPRPTAGQVLGDRCPVGRSRPGPRRPVPGGPCGPTAAGSSAGWAARFRRAGRSRGHGQGMGLPVLVWHYSVQIVLAFATHSA